MVINGRSIGEFVGLKMYLKKVNKKCKQTADKILIYKNEMKCTKAVVLELLYSNSPIISQSTGQPEIKRETKIVTD